MNPELRRGMPVRDRLMHYVAFAGDCWNWTGSGHGGGRRYGGLTVAGRRRYAHAVAYETFVGPIPEGLELDHLCRNRWCVNPGHLEPVTHAENMRRSGPARRTHCLRGHTDPMVATSRERVCRECRREDNRTYRRRKVA